MIQDLSEIEVLALTIYGEARGELIEGQVAVAAVIRNRVNTRKQTYKDICLEPKQFSCWNEFDPNYPILSGLADKMLAPGGLVPEPILKQCLYVAVGTINGSLIDNTKGSKNYMTNDLYKSKMVHWASEMQIGAVIGKQTFLV